MLFELSNADDLPTLVTEMLRLGNDRQGFRWFAAAGDADSKRVLLRVIGPPYYTLLRALDKTPAGTKGIVRAYLERAPRVWVEIGHTHPLASQIRVAEKQLAAHPRAARVALPGRARRSRTCTTSCSSSSRPAPVEWTEAKAPKKMTVPLRLTAGNAADVPELWVLRDNAVEQLDALVRDSDDRLTQRLMFAVATDPKGTRTVVLRTRPSKLAPPALPLENARRRSSRSGSCRTCSSRPAGGCTRRSAATRSASSSPTTRIRSSGSTPTRTAASRPRACRTARSARWKTGSITSSRRSSSRSPRGSRRRGSTSSTSSARTAAGRRPSRTRATRSRGARRGDECAGAKAAIPQPKAAGQGQACREADRPAEFLAAPEEVKKPSEWKIRRAELEKQFQEIEGGLDAPERASALAATGGRQRRHSRGDRGGDLLAQRHVECRSHPGRVAAARGCEASCRVPAGAIKAERVRSSAGQQSVGQKEARTVVASFLWLAARIPSRRG